MKLITTINDRKIFHLPLTQGWQAASPEKDWCAFIIIDEKNTRLATEIALLCFNTKVKYVCVGGIESEWLHDFLDNFFGNQKDSYFVMTTWDRDVEEEFWFACYAAIRDEVDIKSIVCIDMDEKPNRMMNIINSELNSKKITDPQNTIKELKRILNEWDFLGVYHHTNGHLDDEYDSLIPVLRKLIYTHASKKEIKTYLIDELKNYFGTSAGKSIDKVVNKIYEINYSGKKASKKSKIKKILKYFFLIFIFLVILPIFITSPKTKRNTENLKKTQPGMTAEEVVAIMGKPINIVDTPLHPQYEYTYRSPGGILSPGDYIIFFDKDSNRVKSVYKGD